MKLEAAGMSPVIQYAMTEYNVVTQKAVGSSVVIVAR